MEPTSTKQISKRMLLNETTGAFDGTRIHEWSISNHTAIYCVTPHLANIHDNDINF